MAGNTAHANTSGKETLDATRKLSSREEKKKVRAIGVLFSSTSGHYVPGTAVNLLWREVTGTIRCVAAPSRGQPMLEIWTRRAQAALTRFDSPPWQSTRKTTGDVTTEMR